MCGIHGVINASNAHKGYLEKYIEEGFIVNSVRGMDSSGVLQIDSNNEPFMHKMTIPGPMFIENKATKSFISDASKPGWMTLCHVRAATHGKIKVDNAHPFMVPGPNGKRIIGMHNGTLSSWKGKTDAGKFDVDSEWGLTHIGRHGVKAFEDIDGAFVFVWWDEDHPGKMFAVRNTGRPLWFVMTKDKSQMLFGSESGMVSWLCERHTVDTEEFIYELDPMKLYTFDYTGKEITFTKEPIPGYVTRYSPASPAYHPAANDSWNNRQKARQDAQAAFGGGDDMAGDGGEWEWDDHLGFSRNDEGRRGPSAAADSFPATARRVVDDSKRVLSDARAAIFKAEAIGAVTGGSVVQTQILGQREDDSPESLKERAQSNKAKRRAKKAAKAQARAQRATLHLTKPRATTLAEGLRRATEQANAEVEQFNAAIKAGHDRAAAEVDRSFPEEILPEGWFSAGGATTAERTGAKELGIYGQIQWMIGTAYEPETGELLGDIEDYIPGTGKKNYVGILRNTTASIAQREYMHSGCWVAVIGVTYLREWGGKVLIVGELTAEGKTGMMRRQAA